jgi:hypothetical protein
MAKKVALNPKELMAAETSAVNLTFKNLEVAAASNTFEDNESENDESGDGSGEDSGDGGENSGSDDGKQSPDKVSRCMVRCNNSQLLPYVSICCAMSMQVVGKEGWLYRENEPQLRLAEPFTKVTNWMTFSCSELKLIAATEFLHCRCGCQCWSGGSCSQKTVEPTVAPLLYLRRLGKSRASASGTSTWCPARK